MSESEPVGDLLDSLGIHYTPTDGELVAGALVLMKVVTDDGGVMLRSTWSDGMSWLERLGMLRAAQQQDLPSCGGGWNDEDDDEP